MHAADAAVRVVALAGGQHPLQAVRPVGADRAAVVLAPDLRVEVPVARGRGRADRHERRRGRVVSAREDVVHRHRVRVVAGQEHREERGRKAPVGPDGDADDLRRRRGVDHGEDGVQRLALRLVVLDFEVRQEERRRGVRADVAARRVRGGDGAGGGGGVDGEEQKQREREPLHFATPPCCSGFVQPLPRAVASYSTP